MTYPPIPEKTCTKCLILKTKDAFAASTTRKSGLASWCRECCRVYALDPRVTQVRKNRRNEKYQSDMSFRAASIARSVYHRAAKIGVTFDLTKEWVEERLSSGCAITGLPFSFSFGGRGAYSPSVDRIDSSLGYTSSNCRLVLWSVNSALGTWGLEVFRPIADAIAKASELDRVA